MMTLDGYIDNVSRRYKLGNSTEHTFRGDLQQLIESQVRDVRATNEPKRQACGAPDYILTRNDIPVGFIEAKDIGDKDLSGIKKTGNKEQFDRYKTSLNNLIFTDYLDFHLYRDGEFITKIAIAELVNNNIKPLPENFTSFINLIKDFSIQKGQTIKSPKKLAEMMASKARLLADVIEKSLTSDEKNQEDSTLKEQMEAFRQILIHDITPKGFADVYAQTIAYGMFAARLHDATLPTFSRQEAAELIPKSNPFLRKLFGYIAGPDIDDRIKWIVDSLVEIFLACNVEDILKSYGKQTKMEDPIIHFYETFLSEYDPALRKSRGVWYTPAPVVNFIVRSVDEVLKTEFDLPNGLSDTSKTKVRVNLQATDKRYKDNIKTVEEEVHKVQILDPATGTGTFLAEIVKHIYKRFEGQQGIWSSYVEKHLVPRLNGFELLMASYAMAHLKLDLLFTETGYKPTKDQRFRIYLTNSLEESHPDTGTLFANWLSSEANEANYVKRDTPVMCVIGNPPYSVSSNNKNPWIDKLIADYKKNLNERNIQPLSDDYIKFIRFGQHFIDKNGSGVLAYISNNSFIDGIIHRQMRKHLLETFDKIYVLDLHGNSKKQETTNEGGKDENVFDIMQGVSINIFLKTGKKKKDELSEVYHADFYGKRDAKYESLLNNTISTIEWEKLVLRSPEYSFVKRQHSIYEKYSENFSVHSLFNVNSLGIEFGSKELLLNQEKSILKEFVQSTLLNPSVSSEQIEQRHGIKETSGWRFESLRRTELKNGFNESLIRECLNYPFSIEFTYHSAILRRGQLNTLRHIHEPNIVLLAFRQFRAAGFGGVFVSNTIYSKDALSIVDRVTGFPLYVYPDINGQQSIIQTTERIPNLNLTIVNQIADSLNLAFVKEKENSNETFSPIDLFDYIYAVLHSPSYTDEYEEFLKIDYPRVSYPKDKNIFWQLVKLGGEIRKIHLLESAVVGTYITQYPVDGDNVVSKLRYEGDKVYINDTQYFKGVPQKAWDFYIGGYQPAQKWLKDRKGKTLSFDDILHYQSIIVALFESDRIITEIDAVYGA